MIALAGAVVLWLALCLPLREVHATLQPGYDRASVGLYDFSTLLLLAPLLAWSGVALNLVIWLIPPLRRLSERPAKSNPALGFKPMTLELVRFGLWSTLITAPIVAAATLWAP